MLLGTERKEETGFKNICFQCFSKEKKMINQITFPMCSPFSNVIESPVEELLDL